MDRMTTCGVCGETANPGSIFCRRCGAELPRRRSPQADDQTTVLPRLPAEPAAGSPEQATHRLPPVDPQPYPPPAYQPPRSQPGYPARTGQPASQPPAYADDEPALLPPGRPPAQRGRNRALVGLLAGVVALVLVVFGLAIYLLSRDTAKHGVAQPLLSTSPSSSAGTPTASSSTPSSSPPATPTPTPTPSNAKIKAAQVAALQQLGALVNQSGSARSSIQTALDEIGSCKNINSAITTLTRASDIRRSLAAQAGRIDLSSLPNHAQLAQTFTTSMTESSLADQAYAQWGRQVRGSCHKKARATSALASAQAHDQRATDAKNAFAVQWNADAKNVGLPGVSSSSL